jgi:hypothetical protein
MKHPKEKGAQLERPVLEDMLDLYPDAVRCRQESVYNDDRPDVLAGPWSIECKNRKTINIQEALEQAHRRKEASTKYAIVVAQTDRRKQSGRRMVVMDYMDWLEIAHALAE